MDLHASLWFALGLLAAAVHAYEYDPDYLVPPKCRPCDAKSCPQLTYCAGKVVKDHCGCCPRCSSELFQPHLPIPSTIKEDKDNAGIACKEYQCPKFKVCMINMQGLPICTCPSVFVCLRRRAKRARKRQVEVTICGTDGVTYYSPCHMRIANCNSSKRIKRKHYGDCSTDNNGKELPVINTQDIQKEINAEEEREKARALQRQDRLARKTLKRKKIKDRRKKKEKKERKLKERKNRNKRMKRRNSGFSVYSSRYGYLLGKHTTWGRSQVRKSKI